MSNVVMEGPMPNIVTLILVLYIDVVAIGTPSQSHRGAGGGGVDLAASNAFLRDVRSITDLLIGELIGFHTPFVDCLHRSAELELPFLKVLHFSDQSWCLGGLGPQARCLECDVGGGGGIEIGDTGCFRIC